MKQLLLAAMLVSAATTAFAAGPQTSAPASTTNSAPAPVADDSKSFVDTATIAGMFEVETSRLALHQASNAKLKQFARKMIADHTKAGNQLKALVKGHKVADVSGLPTTLDAEHQQQLDALKSLKGKEFDTRYHQLQLDAHQQAVTLFQTEADSGADKNLKAFAAKTLPHLQDHLKRIQAIDLPS